MRLPSRLRAHFICSLMFILQAGCMQDRPVYYRISSKYRVDDPQFTQTIGTLLGPPLVEGNKIETLVNGKQIFPAMLDAIHGAKKSINLETFIFWKSTIGKEFIDALVERARAGVKVNVMVDWLGSGRIAREYLKDLRDAGVDVREYHAFHLLDPTSWHQLDHRTHRKLMIVDGAVGFTGGVGIADEWLGNADRRKHWRDNHYRVEGPVVGQLQAAFCDNWMQTTGRVLEGNDYFPKLDKAGDVWGQMFRSSSAGGSENMELLFLLSISGAGQNIRMESAYFDPDALTRKRLVQAAQRGVRIQILVPGETIDSKVERAASRGHWGELLRAGIEIFEYQPTMIHCKVMIIDDVWATIGSANMDNRSFRINDEANLNVFDKKFAAQQIDLFNADLQQSRQISLQLWEQRSFGEKVANALSDLLDWEI